MASDANPADQASESLKKLTLDNQAKCAEESDRSQQPSSNVRGSESPSKTPDAPVTTHRPAATMAAETSAESGVPYGQSSFVPYYFTGYEHSAPEYEDYTRYVNADVLEVSSPGIFAESGSVLYHPSGYAYAPQVAYGPYSPAAAAPIPPVSPDPHVYGPPHFQYPGHPFYQQPVSPGVQYLSTPAQISQGEIASPIGTEHTAFSGDPQHLGYFNVTGMNTPRPGYPMPYGSFGQGVLPVSIASPGYDGTMPANSFPDSTNLGDIQQRPSSTLVAPIINQPVPVLGAFGQNLRSPPPIQQPRPLSGIAPPVGAYNRVRMYPSNRTYPQSSSPGRLSPGFGTNTRTWVAVDKSRPKGRGTAPCECLGNMDIMTEQNRGPRIRHINQLPSNEAEGKEHESASNGKIESSDVDRSQYNRPDFATKYTDAKFFVIKSYSEDNIHKSIKYGVWASTPNGNKRLDSAYKEAKEKLGGSPVFLFFSVNASGQFCGVAEMLGPVDFERSVDYWQQDKWSGQFPVKWHVIKDVSNSLFRHITLENNDNKPVTNSRDTQEVPLEQGLEMLGIFKSHTSKTSILDDFPYYEARQKLMQEKKARQQDFCGSGGLDEVKPPQQNEKENIVIGETHKAANVLASSSSRTGETQYNDGSGYKFGETSGHAAGSSDPKLTTGNSDQEKLSE